jgi:hypothetical protein
MKLWSQRLIPVLAGAAVAGLIGITLTSQATAQGPAPAPKQPTAGEFFKNVTTSSLKGVTVDEFLGSMGVMAAALGYDCSDCHPGAGTDKANWVFDTPKKKTARKMVEMVAAINRANFGGAQMVTCWTCHHGRDFPSTTIALDTLYGPPNSEHNDVLTPGQGVPTADQIFDKYIQASGGAQRLASLKSFIASGTSLGYEGLGGGGTFTIYAQAPDKRATVIEFKDHPERGTTAWSYNGTRGWMKQPRSLLGEWELTAADLQGAKLDAMLSFPGQIKTVLTNWRVAALDSIGEEDVQVVQGRGPQGLLATLYFDAKTGLLRREVRYSTSPIGRVPTQIDLEDYRAVDGIMFPFQYTFSWLDGRQAYKLNDVKINVPIDAAKFAKPAGK